MGENQAGCGTVASQHRRTVTRLFPTILIALSVVAAAVYLHDGDYRRAIYWTAAAVLQSAVTY